MVRAYTLKQKAFLGSGRLSTRVPIPGLPHVTCQEAESQTQVLSSCLIEEVRNEWAQMCPPHVCLCYTLVTMFTDSIQPDHSQDLGLHLDQTSGQIQIPFL